MQIMSGASEVYCSFDDSSCTICNIQSPGVLDVGLLHALVPGMEKLFCSMCRLDPVNSCGWFDRF